MISALLLLLFTGDDLDQLTEGVRSLDKIGVPGVVVAHGPDAFPVIQGKNAPLGVATRLRRGRIIAFGHGGYNNTSNRTFLMNALVWLAQKKKFIVGTENKGLTEWLTKKGIPVGKKMDGVDVFVVDAFSIKTDEQIEDISAFVKTGGGLLISCTGWAWVPYFAKGKNFAEDFPANRLLNPAGVSFTEETLEGPFVPAATPWMNAGKALRVIESLPADKKKVATHNITLAIRYARPGADIFKRLGRFVQNVPLKFPVKIGDTKARLSLTWSTIENLRRSPAKIKAHPAAETFPGSVPKSAKRVTRTVTIDTGIPRWHSTGLYAAPGEVIEVTGPKDLRVRIGAHKDHLWSKEEWKRAPEITRTFPINGKAANGFGGPVYIEVPQGKSGKAEVTIKGAVEAPMFLRGNKDWDRQRKHPAPWAEIGSGKWVMTVPSTVVRELEDPEELMKVWDRGLDLVAELARISKDRPSPERLVCDVQISAGWLHSGYPVMGHLPHAAPAMDPAKVKHPDSAWGYWHELGHNHQHGDWTFGGTGEVTCNLFTLYVADKLGGVPPEKCKRTNPKARADLMKKYFADGGKFKDWKARPFLALAMYVQLQQEFGWASFLKVFDEYRKLAKGERPKTDGEKRDQWLVRYSRVVGRNLGPFFEVWGVPTSEKARSSLQDLEAWIPEELKPYRR